MFHVGHLIINIINPLFVYLFFVKQNLTDLNSSSIPKLKLPLSNTLLLYDGNLPTKPSYLLDFVFRMIPSVQSLKR